MGEANTLRLDSEHWDGIDQLTDSGEADNRSEAARQIMSAGLHQMRDEQRARQERSPLAVAGNKIGMASGIVALAWLTATIAYPIGVRMPSLVMMICSLTSFGVARFGDGVDVRARLAALVGGDQA